MNELDPYELAPLLESQDLSGAAGIYLLSEDQEALDMVPGYSSESSMFSNGRANLNLILEEVNYAFVDSTQLDPHIGDEFSHYFFGQAPVALQASGKLLQTSSGYNKHVLTTLYERVLRLKRVVLLGISPYLEIKGMAAQGAMLSLNMQEQAATPDVISVSFEWYVCRLTITNQDNVSGTTSLNWCPANA